MGGLPSHGGPRAGGKRFGEEEGHVLVKRVPRKTELGAEVISNQGQ